MMLIANNLTRIQLVIVDCIGSFIILIPGFQCYTVNGKNEKCQSVEYRRIIVEYRIL